MLLLDDWLLDDWLLDELLDDSLLEEMLLLDDSLPVVNLHLRVQETMQGRIHQ